MKKRKTAVSFVVAVCFALAVFFIASSLTISNDRSWAIDNAMSELQSSFRLETVPTGREFSIVDCLYKKMTFQELTYSDLVPEFGLVLGSGGAGVMSSEERVSNFNSHLYLDPQCEALRILLESKGYLTKGSGMTPSMLTDNPQRAYAVMTLVTQCGFDMKDLVLAPYER